MPNFKPKTAKKIIVNEKDTITLDKKHEEICSEFNNTIAILVSNKFSS